MSNLFSLKLSPVGVDFADANARILSSGDSIRFFNELREEMKEKGLTQEILDEILRNE